MDKGPFQNLGQVGVVVRDMDRAVAFLSSLGIGPFVPPAAGTRFVDREVHGKPAEPRLKLMFARLGNVELELIQPIAGESIHKEFLETRGEGLHHLGFFVTDLDNQINNLTRQGFQVTQGGKRLTGGGFAYFDTDKVGGVVLELVQR